MEVAFVKKRCGAAELLSVNPPGLEYNSNGMTVLDSKILMRLVSKEGFCARGLFRFPRFCVAVGLLVAAVALFAGWTETAYAQTAATYTVTFEGNWNAQSTPGGVAGGAHFTTLACAVHNGDVTFWESGGKATPGVEFVAELGGTSTFLSEVMAAGTDAKRGFTVSPGFSTVGSRQFEVDFTRTHPRFTLLSMLGPSPDWFVGVSGLSLLDGQGNWRSSHTVDLFAYDAGTENGEEFSLNNPATSPQGTITSLRGQGKFSNVRIARLSFALKNPPNPVSLSANSVMVAEGGSLTVTATLMNSRASGAALSIPIRVRTKGTNAGAGDYTVASSLSIANNSRVGTTVFTASDDSEEESDETVVIELGSPLPGGISAGSPDHVTITIEDDDQASALPTVTVARAASPVTEGGKANFTVTSAPAPTSALTVNLTVSEDETGGRDFVAEGDQGMKTVTVSAGATETTHAVATAEDTTDEPGGQVTVTVVDSSDYNVGTGSSASVKVNDNDPTAVTLSASGGDTPIPESGGERTVTISLGRALVSPESLAVPLVFGGSAMPGRDYTVNCVSTNNVECARPTTGVTFSAGGRTATLTLAARDDMIDEGSGEEVTVSLGKLDGASGTNLGGGARGTGTTGFTIADDDMPEIGIQPMSASIKEGSMAVFRVTSDVVPAPDFKVDYTIADPGGFAAAGECLGACLFPMSSRSDTLTVKTVDDSTRGTSDTITVTVNPGSGYTVSPSAAAATVTVTVTVTDSASENERNTSPDLNALLAIYNASGGSNWTLDYNWGSDEQIATWYGVAADTDGRVTELRLGGNALSGTIHEDVGELEQLRILYLDDNALEGAVPVAALESLAHLEELALWGNDGLSGTISDELGKKIDRAALRTLNDVNGASVLEGWFPEDETDMFSYSGWRGVVTGRDGRVSELALSGLGLDGNITGAVSSLLSLRKLDLSDNASLEGELPLGIMSLTMLDELDISGTGLCTPDDEEFEAWLMNSVSFTGNDSCGGGKMEPEENDSEEDEPAANGSAGGGGGCAVASGGGGFEKSVYHLAVFAVMIVLLGAGRLDDRRCRRSDR